MPTRRRFLDGLLGAALAGTFGSVLYPILRYLKPLPAAGAAGPTRLTRAETEKLERSSFVVVPAAGKRILVFRDAEGRIRALDARCTHEGCTVQYVPAEAGIWCACHNARFDLDGRVLSGPPPRPLPSYSVHLGEDGGILVTHSA
jgi:cytochrome b6-f complex iron-sulfur subunit